MDLTEEIKEGTGAGAAALSEEATEDLFYALLTGKTLQETVKSSRGDFVIKYPKQKDLLQVERRVALLRAGIAASAFDDGATWMLQKIAFLDVVVDAGPAWYEAAKKQNAQFSWAQMPDPVFVDEVYALAWTFRSTVQKQLAQPESAAHSKGTERADVQETVADGVFEGVKRTAK